MYMKNCPITLKTKNEKQKKKRIIKAIGGKPCFLQVDLILYSFY